MALFNRFTRRFKQRGFLNNERGQALPIIAIMLTVLLGMCALAVDAGRAMFASRELQATTDAAAIAGARAITTASTPSAVVAVATQYSSKTGSLNARTSLPAVAVTATLKCLTTLQQAGQACVGPVPYNALQVRQTATVPMFIAAVFGFKSMAISSTATASARGGSPRASNVAIILDTTLSMNALDSNCGATQMACALNGVQNFLLHLSPCGSKVTTCKVTNGVAQNSFDNVALFAFDNVTTTSVGADTNCTTAVPAPTQQNGYWNSISSGLSTTNYNFTMPFTPTGGTPITPWPTIANALAYSFPTPGASSYVPAQSILPTSPATNATATYQITGFQSDYRTSDTATALNPNSILVQAAGGVSGCGGLAPPNYAGEYGTYYAGAIYAAQSALMAQQAAYPGTENVIIILGDGDSNAPQNSNGLAAMAHGVNASGHYPSWVGECGQAISAANYATSAGTLVYSVAYGAASVGCTTDVAAGSNPNVSPCNTMADLASAPEMFYSDYQQSGSGSTCMASQSVVSLKDIFGAIANDLTQSRLIPNNTP